MGTNPLNLTNPKMCLVKGIYSVERMKLSPLYNLHPYTLQNKILSLRLLIKLLQSIE